MFGIYYSLQVTYFCSPCRGRVYVDPHFHPSDAAGAVPLDQSVQVLTPLKPREIWFEDDSAYYLYYYAMNVFRARRASPSPFFFHDSHGSRIHVSSQYLGIHNTVASLIADYENKFAVPKANGAAVDPAESVSGSTS